jgi:hypothetical protein
LCWVRLNPERKSAISYTHQQGLMEITGNYKHKEDNMELRLIESATPVKFYPYSHSVKNWIITWDRENTEQFNYYQGELVSMFNKAGIKAYRDNKTVFELEYCGVRFFVGFFDWVMCIGLHVIKW